MATPCVCDAHGVWVLMQGKHSLQDIPASINLSCPHMRICVLAERVTFETHTYTNVQALGIYTDSDTSSENPGFASSFGMQHMHGRVV